MAYEIRLPPDTQNEIREYIFTRFHEIRHQIAALEDVQRELDKLAANPSLGTVPGGPFGKRRIYRFAINPDGVVRHLEVVYKIFPDLNVITVSGFRPIEL